MRAISLAFKPLRFEVAHEREHLYGRIKGLLEKAEEIANGHESVKVRLNRIPFPIIYEKLEGSDSKDPTLIRRISTRVLLQKKAKYMDAIDGVE
jgi:hypothetical protein